VGSGLLAVVGPDSLTSTRTRNSAGAAVRGSPPGCPETRVCLRPARLDSPERRHALPRVDGRERGKLVPGRVRASVPQASGPTVGECPTSPVGGRGLCQPEPAHQRASRLSLRNSVTNNASVGSYQAFLCLSKGCQNEAARIFLRDARYGHRQSPFEATRPPASNTRSGSASTRGSQMRDRARSTASWPPSRRRKGVNYGHPPQELDFPPRQRPLIRLIYRVPFARLEPPTTTHPSSPASSIRQRRRSSTRGEARLGIQGPKRR
jgi:hypothetical protein